MHVVVVGAGIAGLSTALGLARRGVQVTVLERRETSFGGASGMNAAIYRPLETERVMTALARRNGLLLDELLGHRTAWLDARGLVFTGASKTLGRLAQEAEQANLRSKRWRGEALPRNVPALTGSRWSQGLWLAAGGVIDLHRVARALEQACRQRGVALLYRAEVKALTPWRGARWAVTTKAAPERVADALVFAAGAHSGRLAALAGSSVHLGVFKRTLALLQPDGVRVSQVVWDVTTETYFRAESGGVLASPCDEEPCSPDATAAVTSDALAALGHKLEPVAPALAASEVRRAWAGLRTFSDDHLPVIGPDREAPGVFWCTALGGAGMTTGVALGDLAASAVLGARVPPALAARRFSAPTRRARPPPAPRSSAR